MIAALFAMALMAAAAAQEESGAPWFEGKPIVDIVFSGVKSVDKALELDPIISPYLGRVFTFDLFYELNDALSATEYFESIEPVAKRVTEGDSSRVIIVFNVVEKPSIASISVVGNSQLGKSEIIERMALKQGKIIRGDEWIKNDELAIKALYEEKGYPDAIVKLSVEPGPDARSAHLKVSVAEGLQVVVRSLSFEGVTAFSPSALSPVLSLKTPGLFEPGNFQRSKLEADKAAIVAFYQERGFPDAKVLEARISSSKEEGSAKSSLDIVFVVDEGLSWLYGGISFVGNKVFDQSRLESLLQLKPGSALNMKKLRSDIQRVQSLYYENGYISNSFRLSESRDESTRTVSYVLTIAELDKAYIESIEIRGNKKTAEHVIRRELELAEGDVFSLKKHQSSLYNLWNTQYFSGLKPDLAQGSAPNLMRLSYTVEEQNTLKLDFGFTFVPVTSSNSVPIAFTLNLNDPNFMGNGFTLGIETSLAPTEQSLGFNWKDTWLFGKRISGSFNVGVSHKSESGIVQDLIGPVFTDEQYKSGHAAPDPFSSWEEYQAALANGQSIPSHYLMSYEQWLINLGAGGGYRFKLGDDGWVSANLSGNVSWKYLIYDPLVNRPYDIAVRENLLSWIPSTKLGASLSYDSRDIFYNPTSGIYLIDRFNVTGLLPSIEKQYFIRNDIKADAFFKLFDIPLSDESTFPLVLYLHSGFSAIFPTTELPVSEVNKLSIDGMTVARGWMGAGVRGQALLDASVELRMPIAAQFLWLDLYFDAAAIKPSFESFFSSLAPEDVFYSFGADLRFTIAQFPFKFYLAKRFKYDADSQSVSWPVGSLFGVFDVGIGFGISL
jgi:outer membrane protein insertion porin family